MPRLTTEGNRTRGLNFMSYRTHTKATPNRHGSYPERG